MVVAPIATSQLTAEQPISMTAVPTSTRLTYATSSRSKGRLYEGGGGGGGPWGNQINIVRYTQGFVLDSPKARTSTKHLPFSIRNILVMF